MNETMNTLLKRRSIRKYQAKEVPMDLLKEICKAGSYAPTASGKQSPVIVCITNKDDIDKLEAINAEIAGNPGGHTFYGAKAAILVLADKNNANRIYDGSLVMGNLMNAAAALNLGSCWIHRARETFEREDGKAFLKKWGINGEYEGIGYCIVGYPDGSEALFDGPARKDNYIHYIV